MIPHKKWRENFINCRSCKRKLVQFIGNFFLHNAATYLCTNQTLYVAGTFEGEITDTAWFVQGQSSPQPDPTFTCSAEETDTRLWLHVRNTQYNNVLILSPDTDVYNVGLPHQCIKEKDVIVQVSTYSAQELRLLNLSNLISALQNDPDLAHVNPSVLAKVMQTIYVVTGCDYISFFSQIGKATFVRYFYQYTSCALIGVQIKQPNFRMDFGTVVAHPIMRWMTGRQIFVT